MPNLNALISDIADGVIYDHCESAVRAGLQSRILAAIGVKRRRRPVRPNWAARDRFLAPYEKRFKSLLKGIWKDEQRTVLANMKRTPLPKGLTAAVSRRKDASFIDQWLYPKSLYQGKLTTASNRLLSELTSTSVQNAIRDWSLDVSFEVVNEHALTWLSGYTPQLAQAVETETLTTLRTQLMQGIDAGEGMDKLTARVRDTFGDMEKWRAERIARTETITAQERGNREVYKEAGLEKKIWLANPDCCAPRGIPSDAGKTFCSELDGKVVGIDEPFFNDDYGDGQCPPLHPNCYDDKTEVYTNRGWLPFADVKKGDQVLSINPEDATMDWAKPSAPVFYRYRGDMIKLSGNGLDMMVTPEHEALIWDRQRGYKFSQACRVLPLLDYMMDMGGRPVQITLIERAPYDGMVYCLDVPPYHTLWVRRNGKTAWGGNCRCTSGPWADEYGD